MPPDLGHASTGIRLCHLDTGETCMGGKFYRNPVNWTTNTLLTSDLMPAGTVLKPEDSDRAEELRSALSSVQETYFVGETLPKFPGQLCRVFFYRTIIEDYGRPEATRSYGGYGRSGVSRLG